PCRAKPTPILQYVATHEPEACLVVTLGLGVQFCEASVGAIFGENPIERTECRDPRDFIRRAARAPTIERGQQDILGPGDRGLIVGAECLVLNRAAHPACPCRDIEEIAPAIFKRLALHIAW